MIKDTADLKGLANLGVSFNPPDIAQWAQKIGSYMLNFGAIEFISYRYLNALELGRAEFDKNLTKLLGKRIDTIVELVGASLLEEAHLG